MIWCSVLKRASGRISISKTYVPSATTTTSPRRAALNGTTAPIVAQFRCDWLQRGLIWHSMFNQCRFQTYNFAGGSHLANQRQQICIRCVWVCAVLLVFPKCGILDILLRQNQNLLGIPKNALNPRTLTSKDFDLT